MEEVLASTARLSKASELLNAVPVNRLRAVVSLVLQWLAAGEVGRMFSEEDEEAVKRKFSLDDAGFNLVIDMMTFVYKQSAYSVVGSETLREVLGGIGLDADHAAPFVDAWTEDGKAYVASLRKRSVGAPRTLETLGVSTRVALVQQDSNASPAPIPIHVPLATLQLGLRHTATDTTEVISAEMNAETLYELFTQVRPSHPQ